MQVREIVLCVLVISGTFCETHTCLERPRPWALTSRTWNKCLEFHGSLWNDRLAWHGPSRCTGTSTTIRAINFDIVHLSWFIVTFEIWIKMKLPSFQSVFEPLSVQSQWNTGNSSNLQRLLSAISSHWLMSLFNNFLTYVGELFVALQRLDDPGMVVTETELLDPVKMWRMSICHTIGNTSITIGEGSYFLF